MQGTITNINRDKGFAFARPDDGSEDVFVAFREIRDDDQRQQLAKNSRIEFTVGAAADGKKRPALNVRLDTNSATPNGNATPPPPAPATDNSTTTSQNRPPMKYVEGVVAGIELVFSEPNLLLVYFQANYGGVDVTLLVDGYEMETGMTDFEGQTEFLLEIPADAKKRVVEILVADGKTPYRKIWLRNPPKPAEEPAAEAPKADTAPPKPAPAPEPIGQDKSARLSVIQSPGPDRMNFQVRTTVGAEKDAKFVPMVVELRSESGAELRVRAAGSQKWQQGPTAELECSGNTTVQMQWIDEISGDNVYLGIKDNSAQSGPFYVSGHFQAPQDGA